MNVFRIAVCMSGQPRTWRVAYKNIQHHFDIPSVTIFGREYRVEVDYFIHAWNRNTWNRWKEGRAEIVSDEEQEEIKRLYKPKGFIVEAQAPDYDRGVNYLWLPLFDSFSKSVHLKRSYEIANGFEYDMVFKSRLDVIFDPRFKCRIHDLQPLTVYSDRKLDKFLNEYYSSHLSDLVFYSDSHTMDIIAGIDRFYRRIHSPDVNAERHNTNEADDGWLALGPGTLLYRYVVMKGILPIYNSYKAMGIIVREQALRENLDSIEDFERIQGLHYDYYK